MDTFKITNIDSTTGNIKVIFSVDGKEQTLAGMPLGDSSALAQALSDYSDAYKAGLAATSTHVDPTVTALVGKAQTVLVESSDNQSADIAK